MSAGSPPPTGSGSGVKVVRYESAYLSPLTEFYRDIWDSEATETGVAAARAEGAARNPVTPGEQVPTYLFMKEGRVLGHLSTIPVQVSSGGVSRQAYWFIGFMVRPEFRNGPIGYLLLKEASQDLELTLSLTVATPSIRLFRSVGFAEIGLVPNFVRMLRPGRVLRRLDLDAIGLGGLPLLARRAVRVAQAPGVAEIVGGAAGVGLGLWSALRGPWLTSPAVAEGAASPTELDAMWATIGSALGSAAARDGKYLAWRYPIGQGDPYGAVRVERDGRVRGVAYIRRPRDEGDPRLRGIKVASLSDWIFDPGRSGDGLALLAGAERVARQQGADALLTSVSHAALPPLLRRRGYQRFAGNLVFLIKDRRGELPGSTTLADWWVSRGDMNADGVF
ncbi:MAG: hypothetical protein ABI647_01325 [Gemmatimonadota bacterium]